MIRNLIFRVTNYNRHFCSSKDYDLVMIRHASSQFNEGCDSYARDLGIDKLGWNQQKNVQAFMDGALFNEQYIDCKISEKGKEQCKNAKKIIQNIPFDLILVSPKTRTLQTCELLFGNKPKTPVIVQSLLAQACRYACDSTDKLNLKMERFPHYDFQEVQKHGEDALFYNISQKQRQNMRKHYKKNNIFEDNEVRKQLMKLMAQKVIYEEDHQLRQRGWKIKKMLQEYRKKYSKIAIVSHWYILTVIRSRKFGENGENLDYDHVENCVPYFANIHDLLKIH